MCITFYCRMKVAAQPDSTSSNLEPPILPANHIASATSELRLGSSLPSGTSAKRLDVSIFNVSNFSLLLLILY